MSFRKSRIYAIIGLGLCLALSLALTACTNSEKKAPSTQSEQQATSATTGIPDTKAPTLQPGGAVHKNETLFFVTIGLYDTQQAAQDAYEAISKTLADSGQEKNFWKVLPSEAFPDKFDGGKFLVAHAYPSYEAIEGYAAKDYAESLAPKGAEVRVFSSKFNSDEKIVVLGVDAQ